MSPIRAADPFHITVCTPDGLADLLARDRALIGRHFLFVPVVKPDQVESVICDRVQRLDGETWAALGAKIGRIGYWEFEDYTA